MGCRRHDYREGRIRVDLSGSIVAARTAGIGAELPTMRPPRQYERIDYPLLCGEKQGDARQVGRHSDLAVPVGTYAATLAKTLPAQKAAR
jgi:hypothetical protein